MAEFIDEDLSGAHFERVSLRGASLTKVQFNDAQMRHINFNGVDLRGAAFHGVRMQGLELWDVEITGELNNVTINGVDVAPLIEAELNRRMPERVKMRPTDVTGFQEAWAILGRLWAETVETARALPADLLHESVGGEWSFIQTLRHLNFASNVWVARMILGDPSPWHPLDLPWDEAPGWDGIPWDREARPSLDTVLAERSERQAMVGHVIESLTEEQLAAKVSCTAPGWPQLEDFPFRECLLIVLNEEWEHRCFAERDLAALRAAVPD